MTGFERLKQMLDEWIEKNGEEEAFIQTIKYLLTRNDLEQNFLKQEKNLDTLHSFIRSKAEKHKQNGWCYINDNIVYSWAVMYFSLPDEFLNIKNSTIQKKENKNITQQSNNNKDNVVSLEKAKKEIQQKKNLEQISLFGGEEND